MVGLEDALGRLRRARVAARPCADAAVLLATVAATIAVVRAPRRQPVPQEELEPLLRELDKLQEALVRASLEAERAAAAAAERDHELRNGLLSLAGITHLLGGEAQAEHVRLHRAVLAELGRLHRLLGGAGDLSGELPAALPEVAGPAGYAVEPMLEGLVTLCRARGERVSLQLEHPPGGELRCLGDSAVVAQIVQNLLANCARHAAGAPVQVSARPAGESVLIEVRDEGPGLPPGREAQLVRRGVRASAAEGSGLGLHISLDLVRSQAGTLDLCTVHDPLGCAARLCLPAIVSAVPVTDELCR